MTEDSASRPGEFDLETFLPYLLNQAAEATSRSFQQIYKSTYGLTRTQWRVLANLGKFGAMTARDICDISHIEKTKVSRAVAALEAQGYLSRQIDPRDRRAEILTLTDHGSAVFHDLGDRAMLFDQSLRLHLGPEPASMLDGLLRSLVALGGNAPSEDSD
jgi:DNA-binding MarR family transcriptional regulator